MRENYLRYLKKHLGYSYFSKEELEFIWLLANDKSIAIEKKRSRARVKLRDKNRYRDVNFNSKIFQDIVETKRQKNKRK